MALQRTYSAVKPDAYEHRNEILDRIKTGGYNVIQTKELQLTSDQAKKFYAEHDGKPFFDGLVEFMTSGPILAMILEKENCIFDFREFIGNTNPAKAAPGTIRADYGGDLPYNAIHASDSTASAERETKLIFG